MKEMVTLFCIAFVRSAQNMIDSWAQLFEQECGKDIKFVAYGVPRVNTGWKAFSSMIDSRMK